jgi:hypothetical protein
LFALFPSDIASLQAFSQSVLPRFTGLAWMSQAYCCYMLLRYGIRGIFDLHRPWRLLSFAGFFALGLYGGFRSTIILFFILFVVQFYFERLFRTGLFPVFLLGGVVVAVFLVAFADRLPLAMQRSLSFLPLNVDPVARQDAYGTLDWRLQMWKTVLPDVPKYLFLGKGYSFSGTDFYLTQMAVQRGLFTAYEDTLISGNYHNGILTLIIPFSIFGALAFLLFSVGGWRALYANYRYGDPQLKGVNTFLLAFFLARLSFYLTFYGQFDLDLMIFTGAVGLSIAINGGVRRKDDPATRPAMATGKTRELPAAGQDRQYRPRQPNET